MDIRAKVHVADFFYRLIKEPASIPSQHQGMHNVGDKKPSSGRHQQPAAFPVIQGYRFLQTIARSPKSEIHVAHSQELGHNVYMVRFDVPPGGTRTLALQLHGGVDLRRYDGDYHLKVWRQATVNPDRTRVAVTAPDGWTVEPVKGLHQTPGGAARGGEQSSLLAVSAAFARN